jgi:signal peptidase I
LTTHKSPAAPPSLADSRAIRRQKKPQTVGRRAWAFTRELLIVVIGAVVVSSLLRAFVGQMFIIPSQSMENTLLVGDRVVVEKLTDFQRGDVVVFSDPGGWLQDEPADEPGSMGQLLEFIGLPTKSTPAI